ncbi:MAG: copper homeostasis protein CutC [Bacteroidales bacterium]|nr:copper homeostasis protein CutC [Bacteroidales bacterium]
MSFSLVPGFAQRYPKDEGDWLSGPDGPVIESCCTTLEEARSAEARGADRIELCTDLSVGGVTPSRDLIHDVVQALTIPVNVLIRPRTSLDFVYLEDEIQQMIADIEYSRSAGAAGIVVGALTPDGAIDLAAMRQLVAASQPLPVTFHRAYDVCTEDSFDALEKIIELGCARLLTSGRAATAWEGRGLLSQLVRRAGDRIIVMPGRGVTPANLSDLSAFTRAPEFHGTQLP